MSYINHVNGITVSVICACNPQMTYNMYSAALFEKIAKDGYMPETTMENLVLKIILSFDCDDNYGEYNEETGCGGYGESFTLEACLQYIEDSGGYKEFDYL